MGTTIKNGIAVTHLKPQAGGSTEGAVLYNQPQTLTEEQQEQVKENIGAKEVDNLESFESTRPLSANQGRTLNERINNLEGVGRFLSLWNAETGLAESTPPQLPYTYDNGCYFRIGALPESGDILIPSGSQYTGEASTTVYSGSLTLEVGDLFVYDAASGVWLVQKNQVGGKVQDVQVDDISVLVNGIAKILIASATQAGVIKTGSNLGTGIGTEENAGKLIATVQTLAAFETLSNYGFISKGLLNLLLADYVKNTDYPNASKGGVIKVGGTYGTAVTSGMLRGVVKTAEEYTAASEYLLISKGTLENIITGKGLVGKEDFATNNEAGVLKISSSYGLGLTTGGSNPGNLLASNKTYEQYDSGNVNMVIGKGTLENVITGKGLIKDTDYAAPTKGGVVKIGGTSYGLGMSSADENKGTIYIVNATEALIDQKSSQFRPITPNNLDYAVKKALTDSKITWTAEEKAAARQLLGID